MWCVKRKEEAFEKEKHLWGQELVNWIISVPPWLFWLKP